MLPTEIVVNSAIQTITIEPFWMIVFFAECHSIHDVKDKILSKLNMRAKKIKIFGPKSRPKNDKLKNGCGDLSVNIDLESENEAEIEIFDNTAESEYHFQQSQVTTNLSSTTKVPIADFANKQQSTSVSPVKPLIIESKAMTNLIRFESCRLSMDNCILPSSERSEILKDDDLVSVKVTSCKLCQQESFELETDKKQQKILKRRKSPSSNELLQNGVCYDENPSFQKLAANCDTAVISVDRDGSSERRSKNGSKKRKRTLSKEIDKPPKNRETSNGGTKGVSECVSNILMTSCFKDAIEESPGRKKKLSKKKNKRKSTSEDHIQDNLDQFNLDKEVIHLEQQSTSFQEMGIYNNIDALKGVMAGAEKGDTEIINNSKVTDEQNVNEIKMENAIEIFNDFMENDLPKNKMDESSYLEHLLKKRAEELSACSSKATDNSVIGNTKEQPKRKRNRKRKKKGLSAEGPQPLETTVIQSDYSLRLPPHLMPQNSHLTFDREDETTALESNSDVIFMDTLVTTTAQKNSECNELQSKLSEHHCMSRDKNSPRNGDEPENKTESFFLPFSSGDGNFQNSVGSWPFKKQGLSDANLRRSTVSFIERALVTPNNDTHNASNTGTPLGTPIDPTDKFQQLLRQRNFSGRQLEISKSVAGHSLCVSHRKKWDNSLNANAADPDIDVLTNISTIQQATSVQLIPAKRQDFELCHSTDSSKPIVPQTSPKQSFKSVDFKKEKTKGLPEAGDIIVFKVLELSDDYTPTLSEFKEARVVHIDSESSSVQVELKGEKLRQRRQGRFELDYGENGDEDNREVEQDNIVTYGISELLEMQVISGAGHCRPRK